MKVTLAATQMACDWDIEGNLDRAEALVRWAASDGAQIVLLQELLATPYFCPDQNSEHFALAHSATGHPVIGRFAAPAAELGVVLPISVFERANNAYFNSVAVAVADADGALLGLYRKSRIPQGPGYEEKFYFSPGDTGFRVWDTAFGRIGVGICWDQWFSECARAMALQGAELLFYPTAIRSEPSDPDHDSKDHWQRAMQGHAAANMVGLVASNRIGVERNPAAQMIFYGHFFIADETGAKLAECDRCNEAVVLAEFNLAAMRSRRATWGLFRDRKPDLYGLLLSLDGGRRAPGGAED